MEAPRMMATMIGSLPHRDAETALDHVYRATPDAPIWPQLPNRHWKEGFLPQYSGGLPGLVERPEKGMVCIDPDAADFAEQMAAFYEAALVAPEGGDLERFAISEEHSQGIPAALKRLESLENPPRYAKVHTTGPISFSLTVTDARDIALYHRDDYGDVLLQNAIWQSIWQVRRFKPFAREIICFLDEPALSAFGSSAYIFLTRERVISTLRQAVDVLHKEGARVGIHVCGNTDWSMIVECGFDIINFDAYAYGRGITAYPIEIRNHFESGGVVAWGIIPTNPNIHKEDAASLEERLAGTIADLVKEGVDEDLIRRQSMVTPSCGMGTMSESDAELVMQRLGELSRRLQG